MVIQAEAWSWDRAEAWSWDEESFIRALESGLFGDRRFELVEGEVWAVSIGPWHGKVAMRVARALPEDAEWELTSSTLPAGGSLPDPDVWVLRRSAKPISVLGETGRLLRWSPADVAMVIEVSDTSLVVDTAIKTKTYGRAGFPVYWVIHREGVEVYSDPYEGGYRSQEFVPIDGMIHVPYSDSELSVANLLADD